MNCLKIKNEIKNNELLLFSIKVDFGDHEF